MDTKPPHHQHKRPPAWFVLLFSLSLVALSFFQVVYRFFLPTDGWAVVTTSDLDSPDWEYFENLVGAPSGLIQGDIIVSVNGRVVRGTATNRDLSAPPGWSAGETAELVIMRQGQEISVTVPIVNWSLRAVWRYFLFRLELLIGLLGGLVFFGLSLFTFRQRRELAAARILLVLGAAFLAMNLSGLLPDGLSVQFNRFAFYASGVFGYLIFGVLLAPALLAFSLHFPQPKTALRRTMWLGMTPFALGGLVGVVVVVGEMPVVGWLATQLMAAGAVISFIHSGFTLKDTVSRAQIRWVVVGLVTGASLMVLVFPAASGAVTNDLLAVIMGAGFHFGFTVIGVSMSMAILVYRLYDLDLVINRALVYLVLTVCVISLYILVVGYLSVRFQVTQSLMLSLIATGLVAVLFAPLQGWVQRGVNRLMYGQRDEPYALLTRLGKQLAAALAPAEALSLTVETVGQALKLPFVAILLRHDDGDRVAAAYGTENSEVTRLPLMYAGQVIGALLVAPRTQHEALTPADLRLLTSLTQHIGAAAHSALLTTSLEQARLQLVTERGEARRQLGSDLHDGVGHRLVGLTRQVEMATAALRQEGGLTHDALGEISRELVSLTADVRGLAHRLFPPELELLGLAGALRERAEANPRLRITFDGADNLPSLTSEVSAALYYIALEAMSNAENHGAASVCRIGFEVVLTEPGWHVSTLEMTITDNGTGMVERGEQGLGLVSMKARAAEVGGACSVGPVAGGGTVVTARVPCAG